MLSKRTLRCRTRMTHNDRTYAVGDLSPSAALGPEGTPAQEPRYILFQLHTVFPRVARKNRMQKDSKYHGVKRRRHGIEYQNLRVSLMWFICDTTEVSYARAT